MLSSTAFCVPSRRTVPLDLFPSNLVAQLAVRKSFTPEMPGESTGGNLLIATQTLPAQPGGSFSASLGLTPGLTGKQIYADPIRGDYDYFGVDDGSRRENGLLNLIGVALSHSDEFSTSARNELPCAATSTVLPETTMGSICAR